MKLYQMITITKSINFKWKISFNDSYKWTTDNDMLNYLFYHTILIIYYSKA
jgi:hypothetical protein